MSEPKAIDYRMSDRDANELKGITLLPADLRSIALSKFTERHGSGALIEVFVQFIGLANSVVANNREMIEILGITEAGDHPYTAEKYNLPTIFGALCGVGLANSVIDTKTCGGCAYRRGTPANQCEPTTCDADWCQNSGEPEFMCHETLDDKGEPTALCIGHAQHMRAKRAAEAA